MKPSKHREMKFRLEYFLFLWILFSCSKNDLVSHVEDNVINADGQTRKLEVLDLQVVQRLLQSKKMAEDRSSEMEVLDLVKIRKHLFEGGGGDLF